eukprot:TRINITY_DN2138_c0_g1_i1.p1 TRINITY_DN2138_c0_g1~~TRINITY_DN2138_c0_g1_i1.p1  ORF type:complete len:153 (-),score=30.93 TRINITY_DN2138_c0_g1_i1:4-462(-)
MKEWAGYDIFFSYRRRGGSELTRLYQAELRSTYNVFIDVEELSSGTFDDALLKSIERARHFVLFLTPGCLDRCLDNEEDWVRKEIKHAISKNKNIIPLICEGFTWPQHLPEDIAQLTRYNGVFHSHENFSGSVEKIRKMLREYDERSSHQSA